MDLDEITRRRFLTTGAVVSGVATAGCSGQSGDADDTDTAQPPTDTATPTATQTPSTEEEENIAPWDLAANVESWAWYPTDQSLWSRSAEPYDFQQDGKRWLAEPTSEGSVRARVENDAAPGNAGFYINLGAIGYLGSITIDSEVVESTSDTDQQVGYALYFDVGGDGDYFDWTSKADREAFAGLGGDAEGLGLTPAGESVTIDVETTLQLVPELADETVTYGALTRGEIPEIDPLTHAALQVGVIGSGEGNTEELLVHRVGVDAAEQAVSADAWPMFNHDTSNTGHTPTEGPKDPVESLWAFETQAPVRSSPTVVGGTIYIGSDDGRVYAIDAATGEKEWTHQTDGPIVSSPAFLRHVIYVGSDDGHLYALSAATGEEIWTYETGDRIRSSPTVQGSGVPVGIERLVAFGSDDGGLYVLDPATGAEIKTFESPAPIVSKPLIALNANGGWDLRFANTDPAGKEYFWNPEDTDGYGAVVPIKPSQAPTAANYAALSEPPGTGHEWYRVDETGTLTLAEFAEPTPTFETGGAIRTTPVVSDELVYVGSWDGQVYAVEQPTEETPTLEQAWAFRTDGKVNSSPAIADGTLYVGSDDQHVYALDGATGESLWAFETGGAVTSSPAVVDGTVYVGSSDGTVYALAEPSS